MYVFKFLIRMFSTHQNHVTNQESFEAENGFKIPYLGSQKDDGLSDVMKDMNVDESSDKKKQKRGGKAAVKAKKKIEPGDVKVGRVSRGKKKSVTHITGLLTYEIDLKKTAKLFGGKFACGTSSNEKADEIVIQGMV